MIEVNRQKSGGLPVPPTTAIGVDWPENSPRGQSLDKLTEFLRNNRRKKEEVSSFVRYDGQQADAAFRKAAEGGYLISPTKALILERAQTTDGAKKKHLKDIDVLDLSHVHIRTLGHIQSCRHLKICILHNNYLTRFIALANCPGLVRLDLHSNQISKLPDEDFWRQMGHLKVLNLHDNGIVKIDDVHALAICKSLVALTLYDTPLSLKPNYRHHTVNSIWSLKALDHHAIGDDEIIEDAVFTKRFAALNPKLMVDLCPENTLPPESRTLQSELTVVDRIMTDINSVLVHGSPVVVIQRWLRGHQARRKQNVSYAQVRQKMLKLGYFRAQPTNNNNRQQGGGGGSEQLPLDFDTYLQNRRPGSKSVSEATTFRANTPTQMKHNEQVNETIQEIPNKVHINLAKLEQNALRSFNSSPVPDDCEDDSIGRIPSVLHALYHRQDDERKMHEKRVAEYHASRQGKAGTAPGGTRRREPVTVQQMLGPTDALVCPLLSRPHPTMGTLVSRAGGVRTSVGQHGVGDDGVEVPNHFWRLQKENFHVNGGRPAQLRIDPTQNILVTNKESGKDVREALDYWHEKELNKPKPVAKKTKPKSKLMGNVSLATLLAVSKAYQDRDKSDKLAAKVDKVIKVQQERAQSRHIVSAYKEEKRTLVVNQRQADSTRIAEALAQNDAAKAAYLEHAQERKERANRRHRDRHTDLLFASDFGNQHTSVSNALIRHDRQAALDDVRSEKKELVHGIKKQLSGQAELVKRYMEHKQITRQMQASQEKSKLDAKALQAATDRVMAARLRVAGMKARKSTLQIEDMIDCVYMEHRDAVYREIQRRKYKKECKKKVTNHHHHHEPFVSYQNINLAVDMFGRIDGAYNTRVKERATEYAVDSQRRCHVFSQDSN